MQRKLTTWLGVQASSWSWPPVAADGGATNRASAAAPQPATSAAASQPAASNPAASRAPPAGPELRRLGRQLGQHRQGHRAPVRGVGRRERRHLHGAELFNGVTPLKDALNQGQPARECPGRLRGPARPDRPVRQERRPRADRPGLQRGEPSTEPAVAGVTWDGTRTASRGRPRTSRCSPTRPGRPTCPATLDEAVANAKQLIDDGKATKGFGIAFQIGEKGDAYHWYPLFTADGGYAFAQNPDGTYNLEDMGVGKEGTIAAGRAAGAARRRWRSTSASVTYDIARETFAQRQVAVLHHRPVAGPRADRGPGRRPDGLPDPELGGQQAVATPFLGVRAFMQTGQGQEPRPSPPPSSRTRS